MRRWSWVAAVVVVVASACGGGSAGDSAADVVVESADGLAALSVVPGSLPEGVSIDDVRLDVVVDETAEPGVRLLAVRMQPDGLVLSESAELTVALPEALESGFMAIHMSGDLIEFLDGDIQQDDDGFSFSTPVGHFSVISFFRAPFVEVVSATPVRVSVDETQTAWATITKKTDPITNWYRFDSDPEGTYRQINFSAPQPPFSFENAEIQWPRGFYWSPSTPQDVEITKTSSGWQTSSASATCLVSTRDRVNFKATVRFSLTLLDRGEPVSREMTGFARAFTGVGVGFAGFQPDGPVALLDMAPGETFESEATLNWYTAIRCDASSVATTSTSTSTTTPAEDPPEDLDAIGGSPQFFDCPIDYQLDIIGRLLSGKDGEQSELKAATPEAEGSNLTCTKYNKRNPHVFALIVEGDGESMSTANNTSYQVRFVINNEWPLNEYYDETGFEVLVEWNSLAKQWVGVVRDQQGNRVSNDADVTVEWLDSSTLQVVVDVPGLDVEVTEMRTELNVYVTDDNDVRQYDNFDVAIWHKES